MTGVAQPIWWDTVVIGVCVDKNNKDTSTTTTSNSSQNVVPSSNTTSSTTTMTHSPTPPTQRRLAKSFSVAPSSVTKGQISLSFIIYIYFLHDSLFFFGETSSSFFGLFGNWFYFDVV